MLTGKQWPEAADILRKRYERVLKRVEQVTPEDVFENLMNAYARAFDPHSSYFSPRNSEEYRIQMSLNYEGIGASLQLVDDYVTIMNIIDGGPAAVAGTLKTNDRITGVGQGHDGALTDVIGWRLDDVVQLIRGKAGTACGCRSCRRAPLPAAPRRCSSSSATRSRSRPRPPTRKCKTVTRNGRTYKRRRHHGARLLSGHRRAKCRRPELPQHDPRRARDCCSELKAENIDGLVLDLRGDGGGYLPEATALTGLFINHGPVVQLRDTTGRLEVLDDPETAPRIRRPARGAGRPHQRLGLRDLRGRDPGLPPRPDRRSDHVRQGHGAESRAARSLVDRSPSTAS